MLNKNENPLASALNNLIKELSEVKAPGPPVSFSMSHLFYALELLSKKTLGRVKLAEQLNVGGGAIRTILSRLVGAGLVTTSKAGCALTVEGLYVWRELETIFPKRTEFLQTELTPSQFSFAFLVRGCSESVRSGIEQRDAAVAAGALYAVILVFRNGHLRIESVSDDVEKTFPNAARRILRTFKPHDEDTIVIVCGDTALKAKHGAFAASWSLFHNKTIGKISA
jgi:hypothetical protein